jgi:hypothetical protein
VSHPYHLLLLLVVVGWRLHRIGLLECLGAMAMCHLAPMLLLLVVRLAQCSTATGRALLASGSTAGDSTTAGIPSSSSISRCSIKGSQMCSSQAAYPTTCSGRDLMRAAARSSRRMTAAICSSSSKAGRTVRTKTARQNRSSGRPAAAAGITITAPAAAATLHPAAAMQQLALLLLLLLAAL